MSTEEYAVCILSLCGTKTSHCPDVHKDKPAKATLCDHECASEVAVVVEVDGKLYEEVS